MGCTFSQETYLCYQKPDYDHISSKPDLLKRLDYRVERQELPLKRKQILRLNKRIVQFTFFSGCSSPLETDRQLYCFMGQAQNNLEKSKISRNQSLKQPQNQSMNSDKIVVSNKTNTTRNASYGSSKYFQRIEFPKQNNRQMMQPILDTSQIKPKMIESQLIQQNTNQVVNSLQNPYEAQMMIIGQLKSIDLQCASPSHSQSRQHDNAYCLDIQAFLRSNKNAKHTVQSARFGKIKKQRKQISERQNTFLNSQLNIPKPNNKSYAKCELAERRFINSLNKNAFDPSLDSLPFYRKNKAWANQHSRCQVQNVQNKNQQEKTDILQLEKLSSIRKYGGCFKEVSRQEQRIVNFQKLNLGSYSSLHKKANSSNQFRIKNSQSCLKTERNTKKLR